MTSFSPVFKYSCHHVSLFENNCFFKEGSDGPDLTKLRQYKYSDRNLFIQLLSHSPFFPSLFLLQLDPVPLSLSSSCPYKLFIQNIQDFYRDLEKSGLLWHNIFFFQARKCVSKIYKRNRGQEISLEGYFRHSCPCPFRSGELHRRSH